jgi:hypothetical protein
MSEQDCKWIEMTDNYEAADGTLFLAGRQYMYEDVIVKEKESIGCKTECVVFREHFVLCLNNKWYDIPDDVAVIQHKGNTRPKDEEDGRGWRNKHRTDNSNWMELAKKHLGAFPDKQGKDIDLRNYKKIIG